MGPSSYHPAPHPCTPLGLNPKEPRQRFLASVGRGLEKVINQQVPSHPTSSAKDPPTVQQGAGARRRAGTCLKLSGACSSPWQSVLFPPNDATSRGPTSPQYSFQVSGCPPGFPPAARPPKACGASCNTFPSSWGQIGPFITFPFAVMLCSRLGPERHRAAPPQDCLPQARLPSLEDTQAASAQACCVLLCSVPSAAAFHSASLSRRKKK